jgi:hypothetical protein
MVASMNEIGASDIPLQLKAQRIAKHRVGWKTGWFGAASLVQFRNGGNFGKLAALILSRWKAVLSMAADGRREWDKS